MEPGHSGETWLGMPPGKRKLPEQLLQARFVPTDVGIHLAVRALQIGVADQGRPAMARSGDIDHVEVVLLITRFK
jgi:hypothetical protein